MSSPLRDDTRVVPAASPQAPSRLCVLLTSLLGATAAQLAGCATLPARPDPVDYLAHCSPEARATPARLGLIPELHPTLLESVTPASDDPLEGSRNLRPGRVTAFMYPSAKDKDKEVERKFLVSGEAVTTLKRVYIQLDTLHLPDGTTLPICGVAIDGLDQYGIPTYAAVRFEGTRVDPHRVDQSPGAVVLNDPRFETLLRGPEGYPMPRVVLAPPAWR